MARLVKLKRPPVYEFSVNELLLYHVFLGFHFPLAYTNFANLCKSSIPYFAGLFFQALCYLWLIYKFTKAHTGDITSKFYHPDLLPNDEYLALKRKYDEAQKGMSSCTKIIELFSDMSEEDEIALIKSHREIVNAISTILTAQNRLRALCAFKMTFGYVETEAIYEKDDGKVLVESVTDASVSPSACVDKIVGSVELQTFTDEQLEVLESGFAYSRYPDVSQREEIAAKTGLSETCVQKWFKIRRAKHRTPITQINDNGNEEKPQNWDLSSTDSSDDEESHVPTEFRFNGYPTSQRFRVAFTDAQLEVLESEFQYTRYPDVSRREEIAAKTGISEDRVETWFKNRRAQFRNPIRSLSPMVIASEISMPLAAFSSTPQIKDNDQNLLTNDLINVQANQVPSHKKNDENEQQKSIQVSLTDEQLEVLESVFNHSRYLDILMRDEIAKKTGLSGKRVMNWFKNRRSKWVKQASLAAAQIRKNNGNEQKIQNWDLPSIYSSNVQFQVNPFASEKKNELFEQQSNDFADINNPLEKFELLDNPETDGTKGENESLKESLEQIFESQIVF